MSRALEFVSEDYILFRESLFRRYVDYMGVVYLDEYDNSVRVVFIEKVMECMVIVL